MGGRRGRLEPVDRRDRGRSGGRTAARTRRCTIDAAPLSQTPPLLLRLALGRLAPGLQPALGEQTEPLLRQAALQAMPLLRALPDLPSRRSEAMMLLRGVAMMGGLYQALRATGRSDGEAGELVLKAAAAGFAGLPQPVRRLYRWYFFARFGPITASIFGDGDPADFAGEAHVQGDAYAVDYTGCAIRTLLDRLELRDLGPWVCRLDDVQSEALGLGLERSGSLMTGAARCDFVFRKGGPGKPLPRPAVTSG